MSAAGGNESTANIRQSESDGKVGQQQSILDVCISWLFIPRDWQPDDDEQPDQNQNQGDEPQCTGKVADTE